MTHYTTRNKLAAAIWGVLFFGMIAVLPTLEGSISFGSLVLIFLVLLAVLAIAQPHIHILNDEEGQA